MSSIAAVLVTVGLAVVAVLAIAAWLRSRAGFTTPAERAVHATLATAGAAARALTGGLTEKGAAEAAPYLRELIDARAVALCDARGTMLALDGDASEVPRPALIDAAAASARTGRQHLADHRDGLARAVACQPLFSDGASEERACIGVLVAVLRSSPTPGLLRTLTEVGRYVESQLALAELDASRERLARAEMMALRAQISPHFIYNALTTIAAFVRTNPDRARELILDFADFTRYSFRKAGEFTTLAEELQNVERYLALEQARFGDRLRARLHVAPETLGIVIPFLVLQPLVENAVRHGLAGQEGGGTVTITAADAGTECLLTIEDDGAGMDPQRLRSGELDHDPADIHVGLNNVDERMRQVFGDEYGIVVETAPGAGTKVILRLPKFRPGVRA